MDSGPERSTIGKFRRLRRLTRCQTEKTKARTIAKLDNAVAVNAHEATAPTRTLKSKVMFSSSPMAVPRSVYHDFAGLKTSRKTLVKY